jgi:inorganic triphosphatase YgiF
MEIEAKYRLADPAQFIGIAALRTLGVYELHPHPLPENQHNTYYDTADRRFAAAQHSLRLRRIGDRAVVTLKGPKQVANGLHQREEWEFTHNDPDPQSWPAGPVRDLALQIKGDQALIALLTINTERQVIDVLHKEQRVAELCLDQGLIRAGERSAPICEIEIELHDDGMLADLEAIAAALAVHVPLEPENRSKLERGLALLG